MVKVITTIDGNIPSRYAHSFNIMKMTQGFIDSGYDAELVTICTYKTLLNKLKIRSLQNHYGVGKELKVDYIPIFTRQGLKKTIGLVNADKKIADKILSKDPDVVFCRSYFTTVECVLRGLPTIVETHATNFDCNPGLKAIYGIASDKNFLGLVTINEKLAEEYIQRGVPRDKVITLEDGVDLKQFDIEDNIFFWRNKYNLPIDKKILLYSGGMYKEKGIESIILTQQRLEQDSNEYITVFIGGNKEQVLEWKRFSQDIGVRNVMFLGFKPNALLPGYFKCADVLMMPYDTNINYKVMDINTTSPLKLFEYMASGRPILTSDIAVVRKIVCHEKSAFLAKENNIESQAKIVEYIINNKDKAREVSENAKELVKKYEWKHRCSIILDKFISDRNKI